MDHANRPDHHDDLGAGIPGHSWAVTATGAMSIGHKGMLHAAKAMAIAAADLVDDPDLIAGRGRSSRRRRLAGHTCARFRPITSLRCRNAEFHHPRRYRTHRLRREDQRAPASVCPPVLSAY